MMMNANNTLFNHVFILITIQSNSVKLNHILLRQLYTSNSCIAQYTVLATLTAVIGLSLSITS